MKTCLFARKSLQLLFIILLCLPAFLPDNVSASEDPFDKLEGAAFSDPAEIQEMDEEWEKLPIKYKSSNEGADIVISLDQNMFPALEPLIAKYAKEHGLKIIMKEGSCGLSAGQLSKKAVDIGGYCCAPGKTDRLPGIRFHTIGISSIALIVHPDNPVKNVSLDEARLIFMGDIFRWSELDGDRAKGFEIPIQPVGRLHCKIRAGHWHLLLDNEDLFSPELQEVGAIPDMISQVALNRRAIGYETLWMSRRFESRGEVKALNLNGHSPEDHASLISGAYPLYRVYSLTTWEGEGVKNPHALKLIDHVLKSVETLDGKYNFVPASSLRKAGWKFRDNELVGEPGE